MSDQSALQSVPAGGNPPTNPNPGDTADIPMTDASDHPSVGVAFIRTIL
jgi:hypothetical protein